MSDTSLTFNLVGRDRGVNSLLARTAGNVRSANLLAKASTVAFGAAMASAAAHALALGSALAATAGAAGLLPGALAAGTAVVGTAKLATFGLADAWKATGQAATSGGGTAVNTAKRVAQAQREVKAAQQALADAQRDALQAQVDLNRARQEEVERLEDLSRSVAGAKLDEESAVRAVTKAEQELANARARGRTDDINEADLAYRQSLQTLDEVRDRVSDLSKEQEDGQRKSVEGSDAVQDALRRQADAQRQVEQASQRLADAMDAVKEASAGAAGGGVDKAAEALAKLSPNARQLILTLRALGPAWTQVRMAAQDATFKGVAGDIKALSATYLPLMRTRLAQVGAGFNIAIRESLGLARSKAFVRDTNSVLGFTATTVTRLAQSVRPLVNGFMQFATVGASFLPGIAGSTLSIAQRFERWAVAARESGKMREWIGGALGVLRQLGAIALNVGASVVAIFRAGDAQAGKGLLDGLARGSAAMRRWLESAQGQERVRNVLATLRDVLGNVAKVLPTVAAHASDFSAGLSVAGTVVQFLADHTGTLAKLLPYLAAGYLTLKIVQIASNAAAVASIPIQIAQVVVNGRLAKAIKLQTAELRAQSTANRVSATATGINTAATSAGDVVTKRGIISTVAHRVATLASAAAARVAAAGQWLLNAALSANPIGLIIIAVVALAAGIYLLWTRSETFRKIVTISFQAVWAVIQMGWNWVKQNWPLLLGILLGPIAFAVVLIARHWSAIKAGATAVFHWVTGRFNALVDFVTGLPGRMARAAAGLFNGVKNAFRSAINWVIDRWNNFSLTLGGGSIMGIGIPSVTLNTPNIPKLAVGGDILRSGLAVVHAGERVVPAAQVSSPGRGGGMATLRVVVEWPDGRVIREQLIDYSTRTGQHPAALLRAKPA